MMSNTRRLHSFRSVYSNEADCLIRRYGEMHSGQITKDQLDEFPDLRLAIRSYAQAHKDACRATDYSDENKIQDCSSSGPDFQRKFTRSPGPEPEDRLGTQYGRSPSLAPKGLSDGICKNRSSSNEMPPRTTGSRAAITRT